MTLESLIINIPLLLNLIVVGTDIIGFSAIAFGFYDILHLKWTGDLKTMITALLSCSGILVVCEVLKHGSLVSNAILFTYGFIIVSIYFFKQRSNPKLSHGAKPQTKRFFITFGKSMKPTMNGVTIIWCIKPQNLSVGDIVVYNRKGKMGSLCHRIIAKDADDNYLIKGDNAPEIDSVPLSSILFKVDSFKKIF